MRYMIGSGMGWLALPFIVLGFVAYTWVADRLANRSKAPRVTEETGRDSKIAKAA